MSDDIYEDVSFNGAGVGDSAVNLLEPPVDILGSPETALLKVYHAGAVTVVGFAGKDIPHDHCIAAYRSQLLDLIAQHDCQIIAFDLTGVKLLPSGMLGVLASIRKHVVRVEMYNCSPDVIEVLQVTHFDRLVEIKDTAA